MKWFYAYFKSYRKYEHSFWSIRLWIRFLANTSKQKNTMYVLIIVLGMLFHRAVLMSGTGLAPWSLVGDPAYYAAAVANHVQCSPELPYSHLMKCLRDKPLSSLLGTPVRPPEFGTAFGPSVDGVVIGKHYLESSMVVVSLTLASNSLLFTDTDEILSHTADQGHYDYGVPMQKIEQQPLNTLNMINAVLKRKTALNKLSRWVDNIIIQTLKTV